MKIQKQKTTIENGGRTGRKTKILFEINFCQFKYTSKPRTILNKPPQKATNKFHHHPTVTPAMQPKSSHARGPTVTGHPFYKTYPPPPRNRAPVSREDTPVVLSRSPVVGLCFP